MRHLKIPALSLAVLLVLSACSAGETAPGPLNSYLVPLDPYQPFNDSNAVIQEVEGLQFALPREYFDFLTVSSAPRFESAAEERFLLSVSETASIQAAETDFGDGSGFGYLFGFAVVDQAGLEQLLCMDYPGVTVFATDGERYYLYVEPTDVQFYRHGGEIDTDGEDWKTWTALNELGSLVREDFLTRNGLQSFSVQDYAARLLEDGDHLCLKYYPYFLKDGDTRLYDTLLLHQPARQGDGGVWAVEQWLDESGNQYLYFPDSGLPSAEYYAQLQEQCDAGEHPELLTPEGAAADFVEQSFGHETGEGSFASAPGVNQEYMGRNRLLQQTVLDVMYGGDPDSLELLEILGSATADNWGVLGRSMYGSDWFAPLMNAVDLAAVGPEQQRRNEAVLSFLLATAEARTDFATPLNDVLKRQREADPEAFDAAMAVFPADAFSVDPGSGYISPRSSSAPVDIDVPTY